MKGFRAMKDDRFRSGLKPILVACVTSLAIGDVNPVLAAEFKPVITRAVGANRVSDRPDCIKLLQETARTNDWEATGLVDWLDAGVNSRFRCELRENDCRTTA